MSPTVGEIERQVALEAERRNARWRAAGALALPLGLLGVSAFVLYRGQSWGLVILALFLVHEFLFLWRAEAFELPRQPWFWALSALAGVWAAAWAGGPPLSGPEARALTEALRFCRPEAPGHPFSFFVLSLASALPQGWGQAGLAVIQAVLVGAAVALILVQARTLDVRPGLAMALVPALTIPLLLRPGALLGARADVIPDLISAILVLSLHRTASAPGVGSGLPGFLWCLFFLDQPWGALLLLPVILTQSLSRPRLGSWASAFRGLPGALVVLLAPLWATGYGKTTPGSGYSLDGLVVRLFHPWLEGWSMSLDLRGALAGASAASGWEVLVLAALSPLSCLGWRGFVHGILYAQLVLALALACVIPALGPACRPFWILAYPLAVLFLDGLWDRVKGWPIRARVASRMALAAGLGALLVIGARTAFKARESSDGPALLETARRIWTEAGQGGIVICDDRLLEAPLEYLEAFEPSTVPQGSEWILFRELGQRAYVRGLIQKRPGVLFSEFLDGNSEGVAQGLAAAMPDRRLVLVGKGSRAAFMRYQPVPRILCDVVDGLSKKTTSPDPAAALEDLPVRRGGALAEYLAEGFVRLGSAALLSKKPGHAFTAASRALDLVPGHPAARKLRQEVYEGSGRLEQARQGYEEILRRTPADIRARLDLARVLMKKRSVDEATLHFQEVLRLNRRAAEAHLGLGRIQASKGENSLAISSLEKGLSLQPEDDEARLILARLYLALDNHRDAEEHLRFLLEKQPDNAKIQELLGKALASKDRP